MLTAFLGVKQLLLSSEVQMGKLLENSPSALSAKHKDIGSRTAQLTNLNCIVHTAKRENITQITFVQYIKRKTRTIPRRAIQSLKRRKKAKPGFLRRQGRTMKSRRKTTRTTTQMISSYMAADYSGGHWGTILKETSTPPVNLRCSIWTRRRKLKIHQEMNLDISHLQTHR